MVFYFPKLLQSVRFPSMCDIYTLAHIFPLLPSTCLPVQGRQRQKKLQMTIPKNVDYDLPLAEQPTHALEQGADPPTLQRGFHRVQ